jgi:galacturonokinase
VVFAPYRICPLGAHIDHQLAPVTAMALDRGVMLAYAPSGSPQVQLTSLVLPGEVQFSIHHVPDKQEDDWGNYARGAVRALQQDHSLRQGFVGVTAGKLTEGGVSSSAAVGVAYLLALEHVNDLSVSDGENIALDQAIENGYLGLRNGILDQSAILLSRTNHLTLIHCDTAQHELIPPPQTMPPFAILLAFSGLRRALIGTDYNRRVDECAEAAGTLLEAVGREDDPFLGNVRVEEYVAHKHLLSGPAARRAAHFFSEVDRVNRGISAWKRGDLSEFGRLITASGQSSISNYECGAPPLIDLYHILVQTEGVYGARFSGGGFRGCCVALVSPDATVQSAERVRAAYAACHPDLAQNAPVILCDTADGARILPT